ncbi:hypothetical protein AsAng_0006700 [Aureispira anguillae]|uniref:Uncharacterized protein n=1 Tax=Aureispira anguillae TaxID=2864201 RepID=A0A915YBD6_9BACT|nr:hypothetical protein AsAng_0006700 [Aureispira anguillae]
MFLFKKVNIRSFNLAPILEANSKKQGNQYLLFFLHCPKRTKNARTG